MAVRRKGVKICRLSQWRNGDAPSLSGQWIPENEIVSLIQSDVANVGKVARRSITSASAQTVHLAGQRIRIRVPLEGKFRAAGSHALGLHLQQAAGQNQEMVRSKKICRLNVEVCHRFNMRPQN